MHWLESLIRLVSTNSSFQMFKELYNRTENYIDKLHAEGVDLSLYIFSLVLVGLFFASFIRFQNLSEERTEHQCHVEYYEQNFRLLNENNIKIRFAFYEKLVRENNEMPLDTIEKLINFFEKSSKKLKRTQKKVCSKSTKSWSMISKHNVKCYGVSSVAVLVITTVVACVYCFPRAAKSVQVLLGAAGTGIFFYEFYLLNNIEKRVKQLIHEINECKARSDRIVTELSSKLIQLQLEQEVV